MNIPEKHFPLLLEKAKSLSETAGHRVVAGIFYKNDSWIGNNSYKTHPFANRYLKKQEAVYLHAEIDAVIKAIRELSNWELARSTLLVARVKRPRPRCSLWISGLARPCSGCLRCIVAFDIRKVFYTLDDDDGWERL